MNTRFHILLFLILLITLPACSPAGSTPEATSTPLPPTSSAPPDLLEPFTYDPLLPLDIDWGKTRETEGVEVHTISYASLMGDRVPAYYVKPVGEGPYPAVIFLHCGHNASCTKAEFAYEANQLAQRGIASLSIDGPLLRMSDANFDPEQMFIYSVLDIRRGVDLLVSQPEIDGGKIGYVGHSYGASTGGILAGVETRIKALVFMVGHPQVSVANAEPEIEHLDAIHFIPYSGHAASLFQFAEQDLFIDSEAAAYYFEIALEPKEIRWYDADHDLNSQAMYDRLDWLEEHLK